MDWSLSRVGKYYGATHLELAGESRSLIKRDENNEEHYIGITEQKERNETKHLKRFISVIKIDDSEINKIYKYME